MPKKTEVKADINIVMPNSYEAEQNVLCCILRDVPKQQDLIQSLSEEDFYASKHVIIFRAMQKISVGVFEANGNIVPSTVTIATLVDSLQRSGELALVGDISYLVSLQDMLPGTANAFEYISIVKRASKMRKLINICSKITQMAYSSANAEDVITFAEEQIFQLSQGSNNGGLQPLADVAAKAITKICERYINPGNSMGIQTGYKQFDRLTNGLHEGELIVLAARPGVGKSAMAMNIAQSVAESGKSVAVFSLEMSNEQLVERLLSSMSGVPMEFVKSGQFENGEADLARLRTAYNTICSKMKLFGNDYANIKPSEIASQCRKQKKDFGLDLIIIDYIQLMNSDQSGLAMENRQVQVSNITRSLKLIAKQLKIPIIALSQLKRDAEIRNIKGEKGSNEPVLSDLRESGSIEQDADIVLFIHKIPTEQVISNTHMLIVAKHRNGEQGRIPLYWIGKIVRFVDNDYLVKHHIQLPQTTTEAEGQDEQQAVSYDETPDEVVESYNPEESEVPAEYDGNISDFDDEE